MPFFGGSSKTTQVAQNYQVGVQGGLGIGGQAKGTLLGQGVTLGEAGVSGVANEVSYNITSTTLDPEIALAAIGGSQATVERALDIVSTVQRDANDAVGSAGAEARLIAAQSLPTRTGNPDTLFAAQSKLSKEAVFGFGILVSIGLAVYIYKLK